MRTEITIPFAFDTTPIETMLQEHGEEEALRIIERMVEENVVSKVPKKRDYYGCENPDWARYVDMRFDRWLESHMDEVIDEAALLLAAKAGRKGKWRDVLKELKELKEEQA